MAKVSVAKLIGSCHRGWSDEKLLTRGMSVRASARAANIKCVLGLEFCYLDGVKTPYRQARQIIGENLKARRFKPKELETIESEMDGLT